MAGGVNAMNDVEYAGLRVRVGVAILDIFLMLVLIVPLSVFLFGVQHPLSPGGLGLQYLFATFVVILFWQAESATLGKIAQLKSVYDLDLTASDSHNTRETGQDR